MALGVGKTRGLQRDEFSQSILNCFHLLDKNKDGVVTVDEIKTAFGNREFKRQHAAMVATLRALTQGDTNYFADFCNLDVSQARKADAGFCLIDVDNYDRLRAIDPNDELVQAIQYWFNKAKTKIDNPERSPFVGKPIPFRMKQGIVGDCWFLSSMVGLAHSRPDEIVSMIKPIGAGKFEIRLPGARRLIIIEAPTDAEIGAFSTTNGNGIWPVLLEKAYGTMVSNSSLEKSGAVDGADGGDLPSKGIRMLTNHDSERVSLRPPDGKKLDWEKLGEKLMVAFENGKVVCADILHLGKPDEDFTPDGLPKLHAYTVLGFNKPNGTVTIRNPWGDITFRGKHGPSGVIDVAVSDFDLNFEEMFFEK
jgi:hypothetical protein